MHLTNGESSAPVSGSGQLETNNNVTTLRSVSNNQTHNHHHHDEQQQQSRKMVLESLNCNEILEDDEPDSPVNRMFDGQSVFITGASGFIGRVLLEKLLRCYKGIKRVYILMRPKKNQQPQERLYKQLLRVPIFDQLREMKCADGGSLLDKIVVITGDISEPQLGISDNDAKIMLEDESLSIVFHSAATIKFDEPLKVSANLNLIGTRSIIELCKKLKNLRALCHVSTAYVNSDMKEGQSIEEKLYPMREEPEQLIKMAQIMDENQMQILKPSMVNQRPNTYTYTKALAEHLIAKEASDLPLAIVRPSIVVAAWREPVPGWIDNLNGPTGLIIAIGKGLLRSMHVSRTVVADVIPVDVVVNTMIASAFYAAKSNNKLPKQQRRKNLTDCNHSDDQPAINGTQQSNDDMNQISGRTLLNGSCNGLTSESDDANETPTTEKLPIFHCNSGDLNPIKWGEMEDMFFPIIRKYPSCQVLRYPFGSFKSNKYYDLLWRMLAHYLPALIIDLLLVLLGKKRQLLFVYNKLHSATGALSHFCTQNYNFKSNNLAVLKANLSDFDKNQLFMDIENLDWYKFWDSYVLGARRFVLKEPDDTLEGARRSFKRAYFVEIGLRLILALLLGSACISCVSYLIAV